MALMISVHFIDVPRTWFTTVKVHPSASHNLKPYASYPSIDAAKIACKNDDRCILINEDYDYTLSSNETDTARGWFKFKFS